MSVRLFPLLADWAAAHVLTNIVSDIRAPCAHEQLMQNLPGTGMPAVWRVVRLLREFLAHLLWDDKPVAMPQLSAVAQLRRV